ncbi:lycopene cyclase domain-containing protein [Flexivirga caeni]|uniref:Lycopene cyclase domain-containing protein n=1 Tax=Flexivirga caeni TaxID=2294115 RepID=A0A3M9MFW7_9MICO|nr:lycopene cyclase domain-containing protein [Flexivirga caeni]RNI24426.1 lycopene cyclase domain-containing protein [Flexivirga caeni]
MTYTALSGIAVVVALVLDLAVVRTRVVLTRQWWISYAISLAGQLAVNGWLTGRRIVTYDGAAILGTNHQQFLGDWRICYAPVEDIGFGFALILVTVVSWRWWAARDAGTQ